MYCAERLRESETYAEWRKMLYANGYGEPIVGNDRRHLAAPELAQINQYFWAQVFETPSNSKMTISHAVGITLENPRIMAELLPKSFSLVTRNSLAPINEGPISKRQKRDQKTKSTPTENVKTKLNEIKYLIGDKWVERTPHAFFYNEETGPKSTDPNSNQTQKMGAMDGKKKKRRRPKTLQRKIERRRQERARRHRGSVGN